jgi:predicted NBD/HSP70 family sugar kinase
VSRTIHVSEEDGIVRLVQQTGYKVTGAWRRYVRASVQGGVPARIPDLLDSQLDGFTAASVQATQTRAFDPNVAAKALAAMSAARVTAVDIGGDKLMSSAYTVAGGVLSQDAPPVRLRSTSGVGYLDLLEEVSNLAVDRSASFGVSYAGPVRGSRILGGLNLANFVQEFQTRYDGDFARLNPRAVLVNDGEGGLLAAALEAVTRYPAVRNVILVINGSGLGCAVLKDGVVFTTEVGHVPVVAPLNPFGQRKPCGMHGATYVCMENVAASKAGIEDIWRQQRGQRAGGLEVAAARAEGDELALRLYENSAWVTAHAIKGIAKTLDLIDDWAATVIVGHGGTFQVSGYADRVRTILETDMASPAAIFVTTDFSVNACIDGAAIAALFCRAAESRDQ